MIIVTGATGNFGRQVVEGLLEKLPPNQVGVSTREPGKAEDLQQRGVRVCKGDFAEPATLAEAFDGAEQVLIVSGTAMGADGVRQHDNAIQAAKSAGAKRILYTSHQGKGTASIFIPTRDNHVPTDALLAECGVPYVSLQNGFYAESALYQLRGMRETGRLALPEDGPVSWTARADLAEAAVAVLLQPGLLADGPSPALTGSEMLDFTDVAQLASEILKKPIERELVSDETYRTMLVDQGMPEIYAGLLLSLYAAARVSCRIYVPLKGHCASHSDCTSFSAICLFSWFSSLAPSPTKHADLSPPGTDTKVACHEGHTLLQIYLAFLPRCGIIARYDSTHCDSSAHSTLGAIPRRCFARTATSWKNDPGTQPHQ